MKNISILIMIALVYCTCWAQEESNKSSSTRTTSQTIQSLSNKEIVDGLLTAARAGLSALKQYLRELRQLGIWSDERELIDFVDENRWTALMHAAQKDDIKAARVLLQAGAIDPLGWAQEIAFRSSSSALQVAWLLLNRQPWNVENNWRTFNMLNLIIKQSPTRSSGAENVLKAWYNNLVYIKNLLHNRIRQIVKERDYRWEVDPSYEWPKWYNEKGKNEKEVLRGYVTDHVRCYKLEGLECSSHLKAIEHFLYVTATDVNAPIEAYKPERLPFHTALEHGDVDLARVLMEAGANVNLLTENYEAPLYLALKYSLSKEPAEISQQELELFKLLLGEFYIMIDDQSLALIKAYPRLRTIIKNVLKSNVSMNPGTRGFFEQFIDAEPQQAKTQEKSDIKEPVTREGWVSWLARMARSIAGTIQEGSKGGSAAGIIPGRKGAQEEMESKSDERAAYEWAMLHPGEKGKGKD